MNRHVIDALYTDLSESLKNSKETIDALFAIQVIVKDQTNRINKLLVHFRKKHSVFISRTIKQIRLLEKIAGTKNIAGKPNYDVLKEMNASLTSIRNKAYAIDKHLQYLQTEDGFLLKNTTPMIAGDLKKMQKDIDKIKSDIQPYIVSAKANM